jgi:hypothetical protein
MWLLQERDDEHKNWRKNPSFGNKNSASSVAIGGNGK